MGGLSIIILTFNQLSLTRQCLKSLSGFVGRADCEVIVVDNGSSDGTAEALHGEFPFVRTVMNSRNLGVAKGRNIGLRLARFDKILILDNDTIASTDSIIGMERYLDDNPSVGLCGCRLVSTDGRTQKSYKEYPGLFVKLKNLLEKDKSGVVYDVPDTEFSPVYVIGACQMVRRSVVDKVGLLDEHIFFGPEDADFCIRVNKAGWKVVYLPQFSIVHLWQRTSSKRLFSKIALKHTVSLLYFYCKHHRIW